MLGGKRIPINGRGGVDVDHPVFAVECKYRRVLPQWITQAVAQAKRDPQNRLPIVPVRWAGRDEAVFIMPERTFLEMARAAGMVFDSEEGTGS